tara:strand:+ start:620 stop:814 length:195 start_codon:yes stop_codon:yes gene_type:complete
MNDTKVDTKPEIKKEPKPAVRVCKYCDKPLRKIGIERKNGKKIYNKTGKDWATREYHKKCYKLI